MQVFVDGFLWQAKWHYAEGDNLCGQGHNKWNEKKYEVEILVPHNSPNVNIVLTSTLDEEAPNESWGFREFTLSYMACPGECAVCNDDDADKCFMWEKMEMSWAREHVNLEGWTLDGGNAKEMNCAGVNIFGG
jgi:hypothetical protein